MKKIIFVSALIAMAGLTMAQENAWSDVEQLFGRKGTQQGASIKFPFPRTDLKVKVGEVAVDPGLALTSWIAFAQMGNEAMMMGDLVLLDKEVAGVVQGIVNGGIDVTAIHNHIIDESPSIKYLHFQGHGDAVKLAEGMKKVLALTGTPLSAPQTAQAPQAGDWSTVDSVIGRTGTHKGNLLLYGIPRAEKITENGMEIPAFMGMATAVNFQKIGENVATTGDFVLQASEVRNVVHALTENHIAVTAIHSHMLFESPRLFFLHFWGFGPPATIASGIKAALDVTNSVKPG